MDHPIRVLYSTIPLLTCLHHRLQVGWGGEKSDYLTRMFATICLGQFQLCFCSTQTLGTLLTYLPRSHNNPSFISSYHSSVNLFLLVSLPPSLSLSFCLFLSSYFGSQSVWPDFAKFRHFSKIKKSWAIFGGMIWYSVNFLTCFGKHHMLLGPF